MKNRVWRVPHGRDRFDGAITRPIANPGSYLTVLGQSQGQFTTTPQEARTLANEGEIRRCIDVVVPGYQAIVADGGIVNNPFTSVRCTCSQGGLGQKTQQNGFPDPWIPGGRYSLDVMSTLRTYDSRYYGLGGMFDAVNPMNTWSWASLVDIDRHIMAAKTVAMSRVDQSLADGLVGLGELKQTLVGLVTPLSNIRNVLRRMSSRFNRRKRVLYDSDELTSAVANDYLALYYGLLPFCRDIESYLNAYIRSGAQQLRITARGTSSDSQTVRDEYTWTPTAGISTYSHLFTKTEELVTRSGILYVPSPLTWQKACGIRFSDFLGAAYQLTPWSFFVDYFSNLGELINAITPRWDVRYLAAWNTMTLTITDRAQCTGGGMGGTWSWVRSNTEWAERVTKATVRLPATPNTGAGLVLDTGTWTSKMKVAAIISLIIQQLPKGVAIPFHSKIYTE